MNTYDNDHFIISKYIHRFDNFLNSFTFWLSIISLKYQHNNTSNAATLSLHTQAINVMLLVLYINEWYLQKVPSTKDVAFVLSESAWHMFVFVGC